MRERGRGRKSNKTKEKVEEGIGTGPRPMRSFIKADISKEMIGGR